MSGDTKRHAPAAARNREPLRRVLEGMLPATGTVLEIGAGTGQHAVHFAAAFPGLAWLPTDVEPEYLASIDAWAAEAGLANLRPAMHLDVTATPWPAAIPAALEAVYSANVIHIAPWQVAEGLIGGGGARLVAGGALILYGPFTLDGRHTAPSNASFDASLKRLNSRFGVRDLAEVAAAAARHGLELTERIAMPANNLTLVFRKAQPPGSG